MEQKTRASYDAVFSFIKQISPSLAPMKIISDFESALQRSLNESFPESQIVGCWFHSANVSSLVKLYVELRLLCCSKNMNCY